MKQFLLCIVFAYSLTAVKAQTKEATIDWICQKINNYGKNVILIGSTRSESTGKMNSSCSSGNISIDRSMEGLSACYTYVSTEDDMTVPLNAIIRVEIVNEFIRIYCSGNAISSNRRFNSQDPCGGESKNSWEKYSSVSLKLNWSGDDNLQNRMLQALRKLSDYNKQNAPKEAF